MTYSYKDDIEAVLACLDLSTTPESREHFKQRFNQLTTEIHETATSYARDHSKQLHDILYKHGYSIEECAKRTLAYYDSRYREFVAASYP